MNRPPNPFTTAGSSVCTDTDDTTPPPGTEPVGDAGTEGDAETEGDAGSDPDDDAEVGLGEDVAEVGLGQDEGEAVVAEARRDHGVSHGEVTFAVKPRSTTGDAAALSRRAFSAAAF